MKRRRQDSTSQVLGAMLGAVVLAAGAQFGGAKVQAQQSLSDAREQGNSVTITGQTGGRRVVPERYRVRDGDTLWDITGRYYGNPYHWPEVWSLNPEVTNPHWIYPDNILRLRGAGETADLPHLSRRISRVGTESVILRDQGFLDRDALERAGTIVGSREEHMILSEHDEIYVNFSEMEDVHVGREYQIFRRMESSERLDQEEGVLVRVFGTIRLRDYDEETDVGRAVITEALDPIERGFRVAAVPRNFRWVDPVRNDREIWANVIASLRPREIPAQHQIVFINVGSEHGVQLGNRFFVERQGDEWRRTFVRRRQARQLGAQYPGAPEPDVYPLEIIAEGRVVSVRPNTSAILVIRSLREIEYGDRVEMRPGY